jgi:hypothetical protein
MRIGHVDVEQSQEICVILSGSNKILVKKICGSCECGTVQMQIPSLYTLNSPPQHTHQLPPISQLSTTFIHLSHHLNHPQNYLRAGTRDTKHTRTPASRRRVRTQKHQYALLQNTVSNHHSRHNTAERRLVITMMISRCSRFATLVAALLFIATTAVHADLKDDATNAASKVGVLLNDIGEKNLAVGDVQQAYAQASYEVANPGDAAGTFRSPSTAAGTAAVETFSADIAVRSGCLYLFIRCASFYVHTCTRAHTSCRGAIAHPMPHHTLHLSTSTRTHTHAHAHSTTVQLLYHCRRVSAQTSQL